MLWFGITGFQRYTGIYFYKKEEKKRGKQKKKKNKKKKKNRDLKIYIITQLGAYALREIQLKDDDKL